jgi:hypothetical protein
MSLELVLTETGIRKRYDLLSNYLKNNDVGELNEEESNYFREIFTRFYTPEERELDSKFPASIISKVHIIKRAFSNNCFSLVVDDVPWPASIRRLCGSKITDRSNLIRAHRNAIEGQIMQFRISNPLCIESICPVSKENGSFEKLGSDAQVDHEIPFSKLLDRWRQNNKDATCLYSLEKQNYILDDKFLSNWANYHLKESKLRWVSKKSNTYAHRLYSDDKMDPLTEGLSMLCSTSDASISLQTK